jgi:hypothetical protein
MTREAKDTRVHLVAEIATILATPGLGSTKSAKLRAIAEACRRGEAHDYKSPHVCGKVWVVGMLRDAGCAALANRVIDGEFDEVADAEDQAEMAAELGNGPGAAAVRRMLKLPEPGEA